MVSSCWCGLTWIIHAGLGMMASRFAASFDSTVAANSRDYWRDGHVENGRKSAASTRVARRDTPYQVRAARLPDYAADVHRRGRLHELSRLSLPVFLVCLYSIDYRIRFQRCRCRRDATPP